MLRYQKPTVIEVKKSDVDDLLQKRREVIAKSPNEMSMCQPSLPSTSSPKFRQAEIRRRLGFSPEVVPNDGTTAIHFWAHIINNIYWESRSASFWNQLCLSVRLFVCLTQNSSTSHHRISLIFCNKLAFYESRKVTKPDFRKNLFAAKKLQKTS